MRPFMKFFVVIIGSVIASLCGAELTQTERQSFLDSHNEFRQNVSPAATNMKKMIWNHDLEKMSQLWAENCKFKHGQPNCTNMPFDPIGQNLFLTTATTYTPNGAVAAWNSEVDFYTLSSNKCQSSQMCGHYTQVVWANSNEVGCGAKYCTNLGYLVVCNYGPAGNYVGQKPYSSGTSCSACPSGNTCSNKLCIDSSITYRPTIASMVPSTNMACEGDSTGGEGSETTTAAPESEASTAPPESGSTSIAPGMLRFCLFSVIIVWKTMFYV